MKYKYTFSKHLIERIKKRNIDERWVVETIEKHDYKVEISEVEVHYFKKIEERDRKCLKVVLNPISKKIVTSYFDREVTKRGYKDENNI